MNKLFILLLATLFLVACTPPSPTLENNVPGTIEERITEETPGEQTIPSPSYEKLYGQQLFANQSLLQKGVAVDLHGIYYNKTEGKIYAVITGEDRYDNIDSRDPLNWHATLYFTRNEHLNLFLCDFSKDSTTNSWTTIYCEQEKEVPDHWYGQKTWIVYTLQEPNILTERQSILEVLREEDTFAFKTIIQKP